MVRGQTNTSSKVVKIDFFTPSNLPSRLRTIAEQRKVKLGNGIIAVKTKIGYRSLPTYDFVSIGNKPTDVQEFIEGLAKEDGVDLDEANPRKFD